MEFVNFYNRETKVKINNVVDVSNINEIPLTMRYSKVKDRQTLIIHLEDGKELCITPRLDTLGRLSVYVNSGVSAEQATTVL